MGCEPVFRLELIWGADLRVALLSRAHCEQTGGDFLLPANYHLNLSRREKAPLTFYFKIRKPLENMEKFDGDLLLFPLHRRPQSDQKRGVPGALRGVAIPGHDFTPYTMQTAWTSAWEGNRKDGSERWISKQLTRDDLHPEGLLMQRE